MFEFHRNTNIDYSILTHYQIMVEQSKSQAGQRWRRQLPKSVIHDSLTDHLIPRHFRPRDHVNSDDPQDNLSKLVHWDVEDHQGGLPASSPESVAHGETHTEVKSVDEEYCLGAES